MSTPYSGLAKVGVALLPWLPGALICRFWIQYFAAQSELADKLDITNGGGTLYTDQNPLADNAQQHAFDLILLVAECAFVIGLVLMALSLFRRRRPKPPHPDT